MVEQPVLNRDQEKQMNMLIVTRIFVPVSNKYILDEAVTNIIMLARSIVQKPAVGHRVYLFFVLYTFVIFQSMCSEGAKLINSISRSNRNGRGKDLTCRFHRSKHSKVGASQSILPRINGRVGRYPVITTWGGAAA